MKGQVRSTAKRTVALALALLTASNGCVISKALVPSPGMPEYEERNFVPVPGGAVNAAGGNLLLEREDMSLDTPLGTQRVISTYNSANGRWFWNFETQYGGDVFIDERARVHLLFHMPIGTGIEGTPWIRTSATTLTTRGGLVHEFESKRLRAIYWKTLPYPRIRYTWGAQNLQVDQCMSAAACLALFQIDLDGSGRPTAVTDARTGRESTFAYDFWGRLVTARSPLDLETSGPGTRYEYALAPSGLLTRVTNPEGERVEYDYQAGGRILRVVQIGEGNPTHSFEFSGEDSAKLYHTMHTNPLGGHTRYSFDGDSRLRRLELIETGDATELDWNGRQISRITQPDGSTTQMTYAFGFLAQRIESSGNVVTFDYNLDAVNLEDSATWPISRIDDSLGLVEERSYDAQGRVDGITSGAGDTVTVEYTGTLVSAVEHPSGLSWQYPVFGVHGHWLEIQGARQDKRAFDAIGNARIPSAGRQEGGVLRLGYDLNRRIEQIDVAATAEGNVVSEDNISITRRSDGQITRIERPHGGDHEIVYDTLGRRVEQRERVDGLWRTAQLEYDLAGNVTAVALPNGMRQEIDYDVYSRPIEHRARRGGVLEGTSTITYSEGHVLAVYDSLRDATEIYGYDSAGRLDQVLYGSGETLDIGYDLRSRRASETYTLPGGATARTIGYEYNLANQPTRISVDGAETLVAYVYQDGRKIEEQYGNGLRRTFAYDSIDGFPAGSETRNSVDAVIEQTTVDTSVEQNPVRHSIVTATTTPLGITQEEYWLGVGGSLNDPDRYVGQRVWHWENSTGGSKDFVYDELSNMLSNSSGDTFTYNAERNRLLGASLAYEGESLTYTYDAAGFATSRDGVPITWTATGRMASYGPVSIAWDMQGRPLSWTVAGVTRDFALFGGLVELDATTGAVGWLRVGLHSIPFAGSERVYRHEDFRRNVSFVSDETGAVITHYGYSAYGVDVVLGNASDSVRFVGRHEVGPLMILGARIYDPLVGRFLSQDPLMPILNLYTYTFGNPVFFWDPDGMQGSPLGNTADAVIDTALFAGGVASAIIAGPPAGAAAAVLLGFAIGIGGLMLAAAWAQALANNVQGSAQGNLGPPTGNLGVGSISACAPSAVGATHPRFLILWLLVNATIALYAVARPRRLKDDW